MADVPEDVTLWDVGDSLAPTINPRLSDSQQRDMQQTMINYRDVLNAKPGSTKLAGIELKLGQQCLFDKHHTGYLTLIKR